MAKNKGMDSTVNVSESVTELATRVNGNGNGNGHGPDFRSELTEKKFGGGKNQEMYEAIRAVFSDENLKMKSNLSKKQVAAIAVACAYNEQFPTEIMMNTIVSLMQLKVSHLGGGRGDLREVLKSLLVTGQMEERKEAGIKKRLLGF